MTKRERRPAPRNKILLGDVVSRLKELPDDSIHSVVTSPPYFGLRDYGTDPVVWGGEDGHDHDWHPAGRTRRGGSNGGGEATKGRDQSAREAVRVVEHGETCSCGAWRGQYGLEPTLTLYVQHTCLIFEEVRRVLHPSGTLWLNLGDSYAGSGPKSGYAPDPRLAARGASPGTRLPGVKPKDILGVPWRVAFALQDAGWYLRSDVVWCLSGGTRVYARTQKGDMPTTIKDLVRLDPSTVQLWNGEKWTRVLGWNESRRGDPLEVELRSGERIGCTPGHLWPTQRGDVRADALKIGDVIASTTLPEPEAPYRPTHIDADVAWIIGLYLAEGSQTRGRLQFAGHKDEADFRVERLSAVATTFGGTARAHGEGTNVVVDCPALTAIVDQYVHGRSARTKGIKVRAWRHDNEWLTGLLNGYLHGDGHNDTDNGRWRLGFTRNDRLAADLRALCARLGYTLTLRATTAKGFGKAWPSYHGEVRFARTGHFNERSRSEVVAIRKSRARRFWDIGVADEPNLFALASGVLTHNSKPNPMPESVTDRPTKSHEYVFLFAKTPRYFFDQEAVREPLASSPSDVRKMREQRERIGGKTLTAADPRYKAHSATNIGKKRGVGDPDAGRNVRSVWDIPTTPFPDAHFAVFPERLAERCVKAGTSEHGACASCGSPYRRVLGERVSTGERGSGNKERFVAVEGERSRLNTHLGSSVPWTPGVSRTVGWDPSCECGVGVEPCVVLDPFAGSGTTLLVARKLGRDFVGIELNPDYAAMARRRAFSATVPLSRFVAPPETGGPK